MTSERAAMAQLGSQYELIAEIGRGSSATVWSGRRRDTGQDVAIKILHADHSDDPDVVAGFVAERGRLTAVAHPNLVRVHDLVVDGQRLALVCDLVTGGTLRARLATGTLPLPDAIRIGHDLASCLDALHVAGIVHADLKPENILLEEIETAGERALLTDFGVSRLLGAGSARGASTTHGNGARAHGGTAGYQPPEVALGVLPGPPADVYALGVLLYEMFTGQSPAAAADRRPGARVDVAGERRPVPDVPRELWRLVGGCLRADPSDRLSAREVCDTLARQIDGRAVRSRARDLPGVDDRPTIHSARTSETGRAPVDATGVAAEQPAKQDIAVRLLTAAIAAGASCLVILAIGLLTQSSASLGSGRASPAASPAAAGEVMTAERYDAPTGWLCRSPASHDVGAAEVAIQPCVAVSAGLARAMLRPEITGAVPTGASLLASVQLMAGSEAVASGVCDVLGDGSDGAWTASDPGQSCPVLSVPAESGATYRAVVSVRDGSTAPGREIDGSFGKSPPLSSPIVQNGSAQDRHSGQPSSHEGSM